jgi:drug/metabolite transporter (DMT)-like permease
MTSPYIPLALAVLLVSCGSVLIRLAAAPPLAVSFYRIGVAALCVAPFAVGGARSSWTNLSPRRRLALLISGAALAVHFATWVASLSYTSVAASVLLVNTAPLFAVGFSWVFLHERASGVVLLAITLALAGAGLIAFGDWTGSAGSLGGILLALVGAVTLAAYHVIGRGLRESLPLNTYIFGVWAVAAATLLVFCLIVRVPLAGYPPKTWLLFLALALVPTLCGHGLVNRSLRALPAPTVGLFLLGEPICASALAWAVLSEVPGPWTFAGGAVVLLALALVLSRRG